MLLRLSAKNRTQDLPKTLILALAKRVETRSWPENGDSSVPISPMRYYVFLCLIMLPFPCSKFAQIPILANIYQVL